MRVLIITPEILLPEEIEAVDYLFREGLELLHIRKPGFSEKEMKDYLRQIHPRWYNRLVLHDYYQLAAGIGINRLHLTRRTQEMPIGKFHLSRSCHNLKEAKEGLSYCEYVFLSPVFDSISKKGYKAAFTQEELQGVSTQGINPEQIIALGGICTERIPVVQTYGFGGVAILGCIWNEYAEDQNIKTLTARYRELKQFCI